MSKWREVGCRLPTKHLSRPLMVQILSHTYQLETRSGYTQWLDRRIKSVSLRPHFKPGSSVVREYHRVTHMFEVGDDGRFLWNDQNFKSLSHVARAITGYNVSAFQLWVEHLSVLGKPVVRAGVNTRKSSD